MKEDILSLIRPHVFSDTCAKVSAIIDTHARASRIDEDIIASLESIVKLSTDAEGAAKAKAIAESTLAKMVGR